MYSSQVVVEPWFAEDPDYVELVVRYGGNVEVTDPGSIPVYQAAKISQANVELALFSIGAIAALLAALAITAVFSKEIHESRRRLGILKTIGAGRRYVAKVVTPQALGIGIGGAAAGMLVGLIIADQLSRNGVFMLLGHSLRIDWNERLLLVIFLAAVAISVASALVSTVEAMRESAIGSIKGVPDAEPMTRADLGSIEDD
jgi:putative ABC transport system permease protein